MRKVQTSRHMEGASQSSPAQPPPEVTRRNPPLEGRKTPPVQPECLEYWQHDPYDNCCVCINCLVKNFDDDFNYTPEVDARLDAVAALAKIMKKRGPLPEGVSSKIALTHRDNTVITAIVRHLVYTKDNFLKHLMWTSHQRNLWATVNKVFLPHRHRQHISLVVEEVGELFSLVDPSKGPRELEEMRQHTVVILAVAEAYFRQSLV